MADEDTDVKLNEAFDRLERQHAEDPGQGTTGDTRDMPGARRTGGVVGWLGVLLALVAIGLGSYASFMSYQHQAQPKEEAGLAERITQISSRLDGVEARHDTLATGLASTRQMQSDNGAELKSALDDVIAQIRSTNKTTSRDWLLAEVEYLLRIANQRVLMSNDPDGAIALLTSANQILGDESLTAHSLRAAIAQDLANLSAVNHLDVEGVYLRIEAQIRLIDDLRRPEHRFVHEASTDALVTTPEAGLWTRTMNLLRRFGQSLSRLVDFRRNTVEITPILPPTEEYYLRQNLVLMLQKAQMGLLREQSEVFSTNLVEATNWLNRYFDPQDGVTRAMHAALTELKSVEVVRDLPDVTASLREVRKLLSGFSDQAAQ